MNIRSCISPLFLLLVLALALCGCSTPRPLRGGRALIAQEPDGHLEQTLIQGDNPAQLTKQNQDTIRVRTYTLPAGSRIEQLFETPAPGLSIAPSPHRPGVAAQALTNTPAMLTILSAPMPVVEKEETHLTTELGASQKDTARELAARFASLKGIIWVGLGLFLFGLASIFWAPLRAIIGSITTSATITLGGLALMVLPSLVVGHELIILGIVAAAVGAWFFAHRHGQLRGQLALQRPPSSPS
jgi:hypothetical protein